eukprot:Skav227952  [mRNA]  locus=scaffold146:643088:646126:- [translate_table: standard]
MSMASLPNLGLEPHWNHVSVGQRVDVLASAVVHDKTGVKHLVKSCLEGRMLVIQGPLPPAHAYSFLQAEVVQTQGGIRLSIDDGHVLEHQLPDESALYDAMEVCAGMGCLGFGLKASGMTIRASNDKQQVWCDFQTNQGVRTFCCGDLGSDDTLVTLHGIHSGSCMVAGGFSCQPWSQLGDLGRTNDQRATALDYILRAGYFLRCHSLLLECVPGAGQDPMVQNLLRKFCSLTGFRMTQTEAQLSDLMPIRRHRWWCLLVTHAIPCPVLRPMPKLLQQPTFQDLIPIVPWWPEDQVRNLALDAYETRKFADFGGLGQNLIYPNTVVKTALHGWGNQLNRCPCRCRAGPMSERRLEAKGLFGALLMLPGEWETSSGTFPKTRHIHPWELAVISGVPPVWDFGNDMRLGLAGLGQMASPIQSVWMATHFTQAFQDMLGEPPILPEVALGGLFNQLFVAVSQTQPVVASHANFQHYASQVWALLTQSFQSQQVHTFAPRQELTNSQRVGRENPNSGPHDHDTNQPAAGAREPDDRTPPPVQDAMDTSSFAHHHLTGREASRSSFAHDHHAHVEQIHPGASDLLRDQDLPDARPTPGLSADAMVVDTVTEEERDETSAEPVLTHVEVPLPLTDAPHDEPIVDARPNTLDRPPAEFQPHPVHGGIPAFVSTEGARPPPPEVEVNEVLQVSSPTEEGDDDLTQELADCIAAYDEPEQVGLEVPDSHWVILVKHDDLVPRYVRVASTCLVGSLTVAEAQMSVMEQPIRASDMVGQVIPAGQTTVPFQQIILQEMCDYDAMDTGTPPLLGGHESLVTRGQALMLQRGWVAEDEFDFYLSTLQAGGLGHVFQSCAVPAAMIEDELSLFVHSWASDFCQFAGEHTKVASGFLIDHHWHPVLLQRQAVGLCVHTTPEALKWIQPVFHQISSNCQIVTAMLPRKFDHDCGFQAIAWLGWMLQATDQEVVQVQGVTAQVACGWRSLFECSLRSADMWDALVPQPLQLGGGGSFDPQEKLADLLMD